MSINVRLQKSPSSLPRLPPGALEFEADCNLIAKDSNIVSRRYGTGIANSIYLPRPPSWTASAAPETITPR